MSQLSETLHILMCNCPHCYDPLKLIKRQEGICYYYIEGDIVGETLLDHDRWEAISNKFKLSLSLPNDSDALEFIKKAISISQEIKTLVASNEDRFTFIQELIL